MAGQEGDGWRISHGGGVMLLPVLTRHLGNGIAIGQSAI
jgi:hypothetical protein